MIRRDLSQQCPNILVAPIVPLNQEDTPYGNPDNYNQRSDRTYDERSSSSKSATNNVKRVNTTSSFSELDEDRIKWSDMGNKTETSIETPKEITQELREKIWRISHSLNSVTGFDHSIKSFGKYLASKNMTWQQSLQNPFETLDGFVSWLDKDHSASTTITYLCFAKKALKHLGAKIGNEEFKDRVTLPKKRPFQDDKVTKDQIRRIILGLHHSGLKVLLMLMKDTQARPAELLSLQLCDLNLNHEPPYLNIPAERAKNDIPREVFFTPETREMLMSFIKKKERQQGQFLFLNENINPQDELAVQKRIKTVHGDMKAAFRKLMSGPGFEDMNERVRQRGCLPRYKLHIYSFKKFAFTVMADTLGEIAARAIKGDREYVLTYYRKNREERAEDYRKVVPKISVFSSEEKPSAREEIETKIKSMGQDDLARLQEFLKTAKA
jgi:integrase